MARKLTVEELPAKAKKPAKLAMAYYPFYKGKVQVNPKCAIRDSYDFAIYAYDVSTAYKAITTFEVKA